MGSPLPVFLLWGLGLEVLWWGCWECCCPLALLGCLARSRPTVPPPGPGKSLILGEDGDVSEVER